MRVKQLFQTDAHRHRDPEVRRAGARELDPHEEEAAAVLARLAREDGDVSVRTEAIGRLIDLAVLRELLDAGGAHGAEVREAAERRLATMIGEGEVSDIAVRALLDTHAEPLAVTVASHSPSVAQREAALARIDEEAALLAIVERSRLHDARLAAASRIEREETVRAALAACRSRDKVVAKLLQRRLDAAAEAAAERLAREQALDATLAAAESLAGSVWSPQYGGRLQALRERWAGFEASDTASRNAAFETAVAAAQAVLDEHHARSVTVEAETARPDADRGDTDGAEDADGAREGAVSAVVPEAVAGDGEGGDAVPKAVPEAAAVALAERLRPLAIDALLDAVDDERTGTAVAAASDNDPAGVADGATEQALRAHARAVAVLFDPPFDHRRARPGAIGQRLARVEALLDTGALLPGLDLSAHRYVEELVAHRDALVERLDKARQESADRVRATQRQLAALGGLIGEGKWGPASSLLRRLQKKIQAMEPAESRGLDEKLVRAEKQLAEMSDWQDFAARPKLEALCQEMEALPARELAPQALAKEVRALQERWKTLGPSRAANELWPRFKTAGDTAYEPCKAWFAAKAEERKAKLEARRAVCASLEEALPELESALADGAPDWKALQRRVTDAKREWGRNRITDRKPDKALEARFSSALEPFERALATQYETSRAEKEALIEKAAALADGEITQHDANQAKRLLAAWKQVGVLPRRADQALWERFNAHLGTVFRQRQHVVREQRRAGLEHVDRARAIVRELRALSKAVTLDEGAVQRLSDEFDALPDFPERDRRGLQRDLRAALDAIARARQSASKRRRDAEREERLRLVGLCERLERAVELPGEETDPATLREDVLHAWEASETRIGREMAVRLERRRDAALAHLEAGSRFDFVENESARRDLLVRMEVAADVETPAEDKARRMRYQLENLQSGMTSAALSDRRATLAALEEEWLAAPPAGVAVADALHSRYLRALGR